MNPRSKDNYQAKYFRASGRVSELKQFYSRCFRGMIAIFIVAAINYYLDEWSHPWFLWVVFAVGLGLVLHGFKVFGFNLFMGRDWEERKIKKFMEEDRF